MLRTGILVMLLGVVIAVIGTLQYTYVLAYTQAPPDASQVGMWISWGIGGLLIVGGMVTALIGLFLLVIKDEGTRLFPYWIGSTILLGALALVIAGLFLILRKALGTRQPRHP